MGRHTSWQVTSHQLYIKKGQPRTVQSHNGFDKLGMCTDPCESFFDRWVTYLAASLLSCCLVRLVRLTDDFDWTEYVALHVIVTPSVFLWCDLFDNNPKMETGFYGEKVFASQHTFVCVTYLKETFKWDEWVHRKIKMFIRQHLYNI